MTRKTNTQKPARATKADRKVSQKRNKAKPAPAEVLELPAPPAQEEAKKKGASVVRAFYKAKYAQLGGNNTDPIARTLTNLWLASPETQQKAYVDTCKANGLDPQRWAHLNPGMKRMNLSNVLRGIIRNGGTVTIDGETFDKL